MDNNLKIAFSGPSGLGKSTLCKAVTEATKIPWLSTSAGDIFTQDDKNMLKKEFGYEGTGHRNVINLSSTNPDFGKAFQGLVLERRTQQIKFNDTFVIDRCPIDNVVYMLTQLAHNLGEEEVSFFIKEAQRAFLDLTHVIIIAWSRDIPSIEDNESRVPNRYFQQYVSDVFMGVLHRYFNFPNGPQVIVIDYWNLQTRKGVVLDFIGHQQAQIKFNDK